jgi:hypothetical protein
MEDQEEFFDRIGREIRDLERENERDMRLRERARSSEVEKDLAQFLAVLYGQD